MWLETVRVRAVVTALLLSMACSAGAVDKARHENLYRAAKNMEGAISVGVNLLRYRELLQQFATEVSIAKDKAANQGERDMVAAFGGALVAYKDAETIWAKKVGGATELSPFKDVELTRIVDAYPISGSGSGPSFRFPIDDALQTIWSGAGSRMQQGFALYNGETAELPTPASR